MVSLCVCVCVCVLLYEMVLAVDKLDETGVMAFTALPRDKWGEVREGLVSPLNSVAMAFLDQMVAMVTDSPAVGKGQCQQGNTADD